MTAPEYPLDRAHEEMRERFAELLQEGRRRDLDQLLSSATQSPPPEAVEAWNDPAHRLGRYVLVKPIGRGAMATVWKSWDRELGRWVAVKVLQDPDAATHRQRFLREAHSAAGLRHPNLVTVHDAGEIDGRLFLVMELIDGRPLDVSDPLDRVIPILRKVAQALEEAHRHGVVHRDVKPGNIMVDGQGEPRVVDFGLAHVVGDHLRITRSGAAVGTPIYMAPEQVAGRMDAIGPATDVYAVGAILYEILTGRPPHLGESATEIYGRIMSDDPVAPSKLNAGAPRDLETIALKALDKEPSRRYSTAGGIADDLGRYLAGEPIQARRLTVLHRWRRWVVKRRGIVTAAAIGATALLAVSALLTSRLSQANLALSLWTQVFGLIEEANTLARVGDLVRSRERLDQGIRICEEHLARGDFAHGRYFLGRLLRARGRVDDAERELTRALELDSGLGEARLERGLLRTDSYGRLLRQLQDAATFEGGVVATGEFKPSDELERAHPALKARREEAIGDLTAVRGQSSYFRPADAEFGRAELARMMGDFDRARACLERVLELDPSYAQATLSLATMAAWGERWDEAIQFATKAIDGHGGLLPAYVFRSEVLLAKARERPGSPESAEWMARALKDADAAVALDPKSLAAVAHRASARLDAGDQVGSIQDYTTAIALHPGSPILHCGLATARMQSGDDEGAIRDFGEVLRLAPGNTLALTNRGLVQLRGGHGEEALRDFDAVILKLPDWARGYVFRARARVRGGDTDRALSDYLRALNLCGPDAALRRQIEGAMKDLKRSDY